jgi:hypothetical protein
MTKFRVEYWQEEDCKNMELFDDEFRDKVSSLIDAGCTITRIDMRFGDNWKTVRTYNR